MFDEYNKENEVNENENPGIPEKEAEDIEDAFNREFSGEGGINAEEVQEQEAPAAEETPADETPAQEQTYEDVYSGADSPEEPAQEQEIPQVEAQRVTNQQQAYSQQGYQQNQGYYTGYGRPSYGQPQGAPGYGGPYGYGQPQGQPYPNQGYYQNAPVQPQQPEKKSSGKKIAAALIALFLVFAIVVGGLSVAVKFLKRGGRNQQNETASEEIETTGDDTALTIGDSPKSGAKVTGKVLDPSAIAEIGQASNVGVMIYSASNASSSTIGQGSGIVMGLDSTGVYTYIITCAHVISDKGISVKVQDTAGETYEAAVVGFDEKTDVGVIKVKSRNFTPATFGDSTALKVGDPVYAVGNPGGVEFFGSFTSGHVSSINRPISSEIGYTMKCIQHDAAINPGNSGGMLLNQYGQVVGINSQKIVKTDYEGMSFAIPISSAKVIVDDLIRYGYVKDRAKLSITYTSINKSTQYYMIAQMNNLPQGTLIITGINTDSSLAGTDAKKYDLIVAVNGEPLDTANTLLEKIDEGKVGDKLKLTLCRVNSNYSVDKFDVEATLVEDKGNTVQVEQITESTTEPITQYNPFDYFFGF